MSKLNNKWQIAIAIAIPLIMGGISTFFTMGAMKDFQELNQPPLSPPGWLFPVVWTILYILMGISSFLIYKNNSLYVSSERKKALLLYVVQLVFNFFWSIIFFNIKAYTFAFIWLILMWILILLLMLNAKKINTIAYYLLIPYIAWVSFAGYLNIMIAILN